MCLPSSRWVNDRSLSSYSTTSDHRVSWFSQSNHHTTHQVRWDDDELQCGSDTDINLTCGPTMLCPGLAWPRLAIPQECQFRGNNPTWYPLRPEPYVLPALSPFPYSPLPAELYRCEHLVTVCAHTPQYFLSLSVSSWIRLCEWSVRLPSPMHSQSFCDSAS